MSHDPYAQMNDELNAYQQRTDMHVGGATVADYRSDIDVYAHADDCPCEECEEQRNWSPEEELTEADVAYNLGELAREGGEDFATEEGTGLAHVTSIQSFADAGLMTTDDGFVMTMSDGQEYQITVKRSR